METESIANGPAGQKMSTINPNHYEIDDSEKVDFPGEGKMTKQKDAFLMRPPNNQILVMKS